MENEIHEYEQSEGVQQCREYHYHYHYYQPQAYPARRLSEAPHRVPAVGRKPKSQLRVNANIICGGLLLLLVFSVTAEWVPNILARMLISPNRFVDIQRIFEQGVTLFSYAFSFGLALFLTKTWIKIPTRVAFPLRRGSLSLAIPAIFICLGIGVLGSLSYALIAGALESGAGITPPSTDFKPPGDTVSLVMYVILLTVFPSVLEELLFRGVIMQSLRRFGDGFAIVASSILFGLIHGNLMQIIPAFLVGLAIGYFVIRTGSILTGILIHFVNNALAVAATLLTGGNEELTIIANLIIFTLYLLTGVIAAIFLLWRRPDIFRLAPPPPDMPEKKRLLVFFTALTSVIFILIIAGFTASDFM